MTSKATQLYIISLCFGVNKELQGN